jgi:hypothetical protein
MRLRRGSSEASSAADTLRPFLLGDVAMSEWPPEDAVAEDEPWKTFVSAREAMAAGRPGEAVELWTAIARMPACESRQVLQAWTFLRDQGVNPTESEASVVYGVICEVAVGKEHDTLAAYRDGSSRYLNHSGKVVVCEGAPAAAVAAARGVVESAEPLGRAVGLWDQPVLPPVPRGHARLLLLTPGGFRFGQGPQEALWQDPAAGSVLDAATGLMTLMTSAAL